MARDDIARVEVDRLVTRPAVLFASLMIPASAGALRDSPSVAATGQSAAVAQKCEMQPLTGSWKVQSMTMDGRPSGNPEMSGATVSFTANRLTIETVQHVSQAFALEVEAAARPCAIHLTPLGKSSEPAGWMLFALEDSSLRLGFHDNLGRRAVSFDARPNMVVLSLSRVPGAR